MAELVADPELNVVYFDEAGFSLKGVVPYGWQPTGQRYDVPVTGAHGSNVQVLGLESQDGSTAAYLHKGYVTSETVIEVFDDYCQTLTETTVVVLGNASCHASGAFHARLDAWAEQGLLVYHLPPDSPELNPIELYWKNLKYQLLPAHAWERFQGFLATPTTTLVEFGQVTYMPSIHNYAELIRARCLQHEYTPKQICLDFVGYDSVNVRWTNVMLFSDRHSLQIFQAW